MINYELAILIAVFSFTYTNILTEPDMIFNGLYKLCDQYMPRWLFYPFIHCEKCNSGQIALMLYFYYNWYRIDLIELFLFTAFTIFTTYTIKQIWDKLKP